MGKSLALLVIMIMSGLMLFFYWPSESDIEAMNQLYKIEAMEGSSK